MGMYYGRLGGAPDQVRLDGRYRSSCNAASNSRLEQTEWAQRCLLETSRAGLVG